MGGESRFSPVCNSFYVMDANDGRKKILINVSLTMKMAPDSAVFDGVLVNSRNSLCQDMFLLRKRFHVIRPLAGTSGNDIANILTTMFPIGIGRTVLASFCCYIFSATGVIAPF